jgi:hypothetical protein
MKLDVLKFYKNVSAHSSFGYSLERIMDASWEGSHVSSTSQLLTVLLNKTCRDNKVHILCTLCLFFKSSLFYVLKINFLCWI